jgi:hypothetical protein
VGITQDGNSLIIDNCTITIDNAFDPTTGAASITITPIGGLGTLPALLEGQSGPPPILQLGSASNVSPGGDATASLTQLSPGGPGVPSVYQLDLGVPEGLAGTLGAFLLTAATDVIGTVEAGATLVYDAVASAFNIQPLTFTPTYYASSVSSTSGTGTGPRTLTSISVPAQPYSWLPKPSGSCVINGTVNTAVNLYAYEGSTSGDQVGIGFGVAGTPTQTVGLHDAVPTGSSSTYGVIAAGTSATIVYAATQVASTTDAWSTSSSTTSFQVTAQPVGL